MYIDPLYLAASPSQPTYQPSRQDGEIRQICSVLAGGLLSACIP
jgi:hypothetical protein